METYDKLIISSKTQINELFFLETLVKKMLHKIWKIHRKNLCWSLFLIKLQENTCALQPYYTETQIWLFSYELCEIFKKVIRLHQASATLLKKRLAQVFSCEFWGILKTSFFTEHHWWLLLTEQWQKWTPGVLWK